MKRVWNQRWFILVSLLSMFLVTTTIRVQAAGTDVQLDKILKAGLDGLVEYFDFLINILQKIW